ncbi:beta-N-acetylhexosaminidase [Bacillus sp. FJAT-49732]|uniref:beta-N-acetylhexosaminidase n=1 Tax=Lederbergia citrisecunda TaxID=2833583 RepID=A0A942YMX8_9BACI|nr:beta-N-acetylhexosaminidase [Lederbergia citrisecunda]MBS4201155.1 beta-N-acetylhexosaminidase [Lederbergia citrisecunda]
MAKQRNPRLYWLYFLIPLLILALAVYAFGLVGGGTRSVKENPIVSPPTTNKPSDKSENLDALVRDTFSFSKEGKVVHTPFITGKTKIMEVNQKWGEPNHTTEAESGIYEEYVERHVVVGYVSETVNDIRSYDSELQNIPLNEVKKVGGEPDEVRYYQDETHNQIILVYHVTPSTDLKWILPKPSDRVPNPKVDHISVFTEVKNQSNQQKSISETITGMSMDEKIGQMILAGITGTTMDTNNKSLLTKYKIGGFIFYRENLVNPQQTVQLLNELKSNDLALPLLLGVDQEGGHITRLPGGLANFPTNQEIGTINNSQFSYQVGTLLGKELKAFGFNLDFAPVLDINSNPNNPIIGDRSFGNNPEIVSKLGIQTMNGIQSENVIATIKHFPGHGDTSVDSHLELPIIKKTRIQLEGLELIPFRRAIDNGADVVMVAHILLPQLDSNFPASMSKPIMTDILRNQLGFKGVIITDDMTMGAITEHFDIGQAAVQSLKSGSDIILVGHEYDNIVEIFSSIKTAVQKGEISEQRLNESVERIITLKRKYKINNEKMGNVNIGEMNKSINNLLDEYLK